MQLVLQQRCNVAKQVARFCCSFLVPSEIKFKLINGKFELTDHEIIARNLGKINFDSVEYSQLQ